VGVLAPVGVLDPSLTGVLDPLGVLEPSAAGVLAPEPPARPTTGVRVPTGVLDPPTGVLAAETRGVVFEPKPPCAPPPPLLLLLTDRVARLGVECAFSREKPPGADVVE